MGTLDTGKYLWDPWTNRDEQQWIEALGWHCPGKLFSKAWSSAHILTSYKWVNNVFVTGAVHRTPEDTTPSSDPMQHPICRLYWHYRGPTSRTAKVVLKKQLNLYWSEYEPLQRWATATIVTGPLQDTMLGTGLLSVESDQETLFKVLIGCPQTH